MDTHASASPARRALVAAAVLAVATVVAVGHGRAGARPRRSRRSKPAAVPQRLRSSPPCSATVDLRQRPAVRHRSACAIPSCSAPTQPLTAHRVRRGGGPGGGAARTWWRPTATPGAIHLLVAIDAQGRVLGVRVLEHRETPGPRRSHRGAALGLDPRLRRPLARPTRRAERWQVRKDGGDFDQFTGATVTPRAVVRAVRNALVVFRTAPRRTVRGAGATARPHRRMRAMDARGILRNGLVDRNPGFVQLLGLCPLLAVSTSVGERARARPRRRWPCCS